MNWDAVSAVGEILGAVGVIATIAYLSIQIRQNTAATKMSAAQAQEQSMSNIILAVAGDETLNNLFEKGLSRPEELNSAEGLRFHTYLLQVFNVFQSAFKLYRAGLLDEAAWSFNFTAIKNYKGTLGFHVWWQAASQYYDPEFQRVVTEAPQGIPVYYDEATHTFVAAAFEGVRSDA